VNVDLEKGSWKGIAWVLFFMWPFFSYDFASELFIAEKFGSYELLIVSGLLIGSAIWVFGVVRLVKILRDPF